jgi:hypothetical protein
MQPLNYLFICLLVVVASCSPPEYKLYIGNSSRDAFDTSFVTRHPVENNTDFISFLEYESCSHHLLDSGYEKHEDRAGVILTEKDTKFFNSIEEAGFGNKEDTCRLGYSFNSQVVHVGRSAMVSVFNVVAAFSGGGINSQAVYDYTSKLTLEGKMELGRHYCRFYYETNVKDKPLPSWLLIDGDTLKLSRVKEAISNKGKIKKGEWGMQLKKDDFTFAAISGFAPYTVFITKRLTKDERLLVASYIYLVCSYTMK